MSVDLRKHHPWDGQLRAAVRIGYFGVLVMLAAMASLFAEHQYETGVVLIYSLAITVFATVRLRRIRERGR